MSRGDADKPEQTHIGSMIIIMMGCEGGGRERICTALPCFATSRRSGAMKMSIIRKGIILAACLTAIGAWAVTSKAASQSFKVTLNGAQQVPPVQTAATGTAELTYDPATRVLTWTLNYSGLSGPATMAHFHGPAAAENAFFVFEAQQDTIRATGLSFSVHFVLQMTEFLRMLLGRLDDGHHLFEGATGNTNIFSEFVPGPATINIREIFPQVRSHPLSGLGFPPEYRLKGSGNGDHFRGAKVLAKDVLRDFTANDLVQVENGHGHLAPA